VRVFYRTAVAVRAVIAAIAQELVNQIAVGAMNLDTIETGGFRSGRCRRKFSNDCCDATEVKFLRCGVRLRAFCGVYHACCRQRRWTDGLAAVLQLRWMSGASHMGQLNEYFSTRGMNGVGHQPPTGLLRVIGKTRTCRDIDRAERIHFC
jgi:hypothetical protein